MRLKEQQRRILKGTKKSKGSLSSSTQRERDSLTDRTGLRLSPANTEELYLKYNDTGSPLLGNHASFQKLKYH